jgi:hypothetical protein
MTVTIAHLSASVLNGDRGCSQVKGAAAFLTIEGETGAAFVHRYPEVVSATGTNGVGEVRDRSAVISR